MNGPPSGSTPVVESLACEGLPCPLGVDEPRPRLTWIPRTRQVACRVEMTADDGPPGVPRGVVWDSGWIATIDPALAYDGPPLTPRTRYGFSVRIRDDAGSEPPEAVSWFETGLFPARSWPSEWIKSPAPDRGRAEIFLHTFALPVVPRRARAYVAGLGYHELRVNGIRAGDSVLDPVWTDYRHSIRYVVHDVTALLAVGQNILAVMVATGRSRDPILNLRLFIGLPDGSEQELRTDHRSWTWSPATPVVATNIYHGETFDARILVPGWDADAGGDIPVIRPLTAEPPGGALEWQDVEPIRVVADLATVARWSLPRTAEGGPAVTILDLGQNIAGWVRLTVRGARGATVVLRHSEALRDDGRIEARMNRGARATDRYVLRGDRTESWEPRFTYHGFRYVEVETGGEIAAWDVVGRMVRSAVARVGAFRCADDLANRIRTACEWTEADNLHGVPTDCPQREERLGWLNDMTVRAESALYSFGLGRLYRKWAADIAQAQGPVTGAVTDVAPFDAHHTTPYGARPADPVSSSYLLVPWLVYLHEGDPRPLEHRFPGLVRWYEYLRGQAEDGILAYSSWGDWASPRRFSVDDSVGGGAVSAVTPGALVSTAFLYYDARLLAGIAAVLGRADDARRFTDEAVEVAAAFDRRFWDPARRCYGTGSQGCQALPLALGLASPGRAEGAVAQLVHDIVEANDTHLSTGNLASRYALEVLCDHGYADLAWALATRRTYPGWGYMIEQGATTIWERWEFIRGGVMSSHNHPMYATVGGWFLKYVTGIRPSEDAPGFAEVIIRPHVPTGLAWAEGSLETVRGTVRSAWKRRSKDAVEYDVQVPPSASARLELPVLPGGPGTARRTVQLGGGRHVVEGGA